MGVPLPYWLGTPVLGPCLQIHQEEVQFSLMAAPQLTPKMEQNLPILGFLGQVITQNTFRAHRGLWEEGRGWAPYHSLSCVRLGLCTPRRGYHKFPAGSAVLRTQRAECQQSPKGRGEGGVCVGRWGVQ